VAVNNYLVLGVNPANNETTIPVDKEIKITFAKHMDQTTLTTANLVLKEVNGAAVPYKMAYDGQTLVATLTPTENLKPGTQYQVQVVGTAAGVRSITNDYMSINRVYEFTTTFDVTLSPPTNVQTSVDSGFVTVTWGLPADHDPGIPLTYEVQISASNDASAAVIWPATGDINKTQGASINIPKKFSEGSYYAYVRADNEKGTSDWASVQFIVEEAAVTPTPPTDNTGNPGTGTDLPVVDDIEDIFAFDIQDVYPPVNSMNLTPEKVIVVFSANVDMTTVTADSFYIVEKIYKEKLTVVDFMTAYASSKQITAVIDEPTMPNVISLTAELEPDKEYTVIVRESVAKADGTKLGSPYHWAFVTKYTRLYGDEEEIRADLGLAGIDIPERILYKHMNTISIYAYQVNSATDTFSAVAYEDGAAPYYMHQYVRYKVGYDMLLSAQLGVAASSTTNTGGTAASGAISDVTLGDLKVSYDASGTGSSSSSKGPSASLLIEIIPEFKQKVKLWEDMVHGHNNRGYAKPVLAARGENAEAYPDFLTRAEFNELGQ